MSSEGGGDGPRAAAAPTELVIDGRRYRLVPAEVAENRLEEVRSVPQPSPADALTERERQIAILVAEGRVNKQIADELRISEWTVSTHLRRVFAKLGVDTRAAMVSKCFACLSFSRRP